MKISPVALTLLLIFISGCNSESGGIQRKLPFGGSNPDELFAAGDIHKALAALDKKTNLSSEDSTLRENCIWALYEQHRFSNPDSAYSYLRKAAPNGPLWRKFEVELGHESEFYLDGTSPNLCWGSYSLSQARKLTLHSFRIRGNPDTQYMRGTGPYLLASAITGDDLSPNMLAASVASTGNYFPGGPDEFKFQEWLSLWEEARKSYAEALTDSSLFCIDTGWFECGDYDMKTKSFPVDINSSSIPIMSMDEFRPRDWDISPVLAKGDHIVRRVLLDVSGQGTDLAKLAVPTEQAETLTRFWREDSDYPRKISYWIVFSPAGAKTKDVYRKRVEGASIFREDVRRLHRETTIQAKVAAIFVVVAGNELFPTCTMLRPEDTYLARALAETRWGSKNSEQVLKVLLPVKDETLFETKHRDGSSSDKIETTAGHTTMPYRLNWGQFTPFRESIMAAEYVPKEWQRTDYLDGANCYDLGYKILLDAAGNKEAPYIPGSMEGDEFAREKARSAYDKWYEYYKGLMDDGEQFVFVPTSRNIIMGVFNASKGGVAIVDGLNRPFTWQNISLPSDEVDKYGHGIDHQIQIVNSGSWATWLPLDQAIAKSLVTEWEGNGRPRLFVLCLGRIEGSSWTHRSERLLRVNAQALVYTDMKGNVLGVLVPPK